MKEIFETLLREYDNLMGTSESRLYHCPIKSIRTLQEKDGVSVERSSNLYGYLNNTYGMKHIYVNDLTGEYYEDIKIQKDGNTYDLHNESVTTYRCGIMTCIAISKFMDDFHSVGFIGTGRTNIQNCKAITEIFGLKKVVVRGSARCKEKNANKFEDICGNVQVDASDDFRHINLCDIVVVCTSSYKKEDLISVAQLNHPKLIIALDSGYLLDESFREEYDSYTEYKEQMEAYYDEEFPYDEKRYEIMQISDKCRESQNKSVVYLHGIGLADIVVALEFLKGRTI